MLLTSQEDLFTTDLSILCVFSFGSAHSFIASGAIILIDKIQSIWVEDKTLFTIFVIYKDIDTDVYLVRC